MLNTFSRLLIVGAVLALAGCASAPSPRIGDLPESDYLAMTEAERVSYEQTRDAEVATLDQGRQRAYRRGETLTIGGGPITYSIQWARELGVINVQVVSVTSEFGIVEQATMQFAAHPDGRPIVNPNGLPQIVRSSSAAMEANARFFAGGIMRIAAGAANGTIPALIRAAHACEENCGDPTFINVQSVSESTATGTGNATAGWGTMH
jgi:hypothetical protein